MRYRPQLIDHPEVGLVSHGLLIVSHGLLIKDTLSYGALPPTERERGRLARSLRSFAKARLPQYANLIGIPGIWQVEEGFTQIWKPRDYGMLMLIVPYKDPDGRIQACQLRLHPDDLSPDNPKKAKKKRLWKPNRHPEPKLCDLVVTGLSYSIS